MQLVFYGNTCYTIRKTKPWRMMEMRKRVIALDIGNVCLGIHPERCFGALGFRSFADIPPEVLFLAGERFERGELSPAGFLEGFRKMTGASFSDGELERAFRSIIGEPVPGMAELVAGLGARGFRPVFFSDTSVTHLDEVRRKFPAASEVPDGIYSCEVHAKKPEPAMFEAFEAEFGVPEFYFDDRAELIEGALRHGWNAHRFVSAEEVDKILG